MKSYLWNKARAILLPALLTKRERLFITTRANWAGRWSAELWKGEMAEEAIAKYANELADNIVRTCNGRLYEKEK